jgi:DNA-directed RNA polymerase subunit M/transcription elongation factor TFIIS
LRPTTLTTTKVSLPIVSLIPGRLYFENPFSLYDMDDEFADDDGPINDDKEMKGKRELAARQLAKLNIKSREHHKRRKVVEDDLNESDYVNVTLENLEQVPKDKTGRYKCGVCGTKNKYFSDMR